MLARVRFDFACNNPDNGDFAGKVAMACYHLDRHTSIEFESPGLREFKFSIMTDRHVIRLHRREFPYVTSRSWFGNWCWDSFIVDRPVAKALLGTLRAHGWEPDNVPVVWENRFWKRTTVQPKAA
jgi:hypothetical protein